MMRLGVFTVLFNERPMEEVAPYVSSLGYEAVELAAWRASSHLDIERVVSDKAYVKQLHELLKSNDLEIAALSNHLEGKLVLGPLDGSTDEFSPSSDPEEKVKYGVERMKLTARAAAVLGVETVVGFTGSPVWDKWYSWPPANEELYERAWELMAERWNDILDTFEEEGVVFAHECQPGEIAYNVETAERAVQAMDGRKEFRFNFDPSHLIWQGIDPVVFIKRLADRIQFVHAKDCEVQVDEVGRSGVICNGPWSRNDRGVRFRVPGWGDAQWKRIVSALIEIGYNDVISFEHEDPVMSREDGCEQCAALFRSVQIKQPLTEWGVWWNEE